jgi:hypothetical protein
MKRSVDVTPSMFFGECALNLIHQRIGEPSLAQFGEIVADDVLPDFVALRLLAAMGAVARTGVRATAISGICIFCDFAPIAPS